SVGTSGSVTVTVSTVGQNTFTVNCTGTSGSASDSEVVTLASPLTPSVNVTVSTNNLSAPGPVTVSWMTNNVNGCTANWITGSVGTSGSVTVTVSTVGQNTFTVNCTGTSGSASDSEVVTLASPSAMCSMDSQCPASYTWTQGYCSAGVCKQRAINCGGIKTRRTSALTDMLNAWGGWGGVQPAPDLGSVPITASYAWVPQAGACSVISAQPFDCTIEYYGGNGTLSFKEYTGVTKCSFDGKNNLPDDPTL
ncbi:MAG: hypothetical protein KBC69_00300, partial [Candidatus Magasanikbacteria bacterium]|nr:hypothetical protein [Candidatus Magasanikbacteria bacterium]